MTPSDVREIITKLLACDKLSQSQRKKVTKLARTSQNLNCKQIKLLFRLLIGAGQKPICPSCNRPITDVMDFSIDHIYPRARGGGNGLENLQPMHKSCNVTKGAKIYDKYFVDQEVPIPSKKEIVLNRERNKGKKQRNHEILKISQLTTIDYDGR